MKRSASYEVDTSTNNYTTRYVRPSPDGNKTIRSSLTGSLNQERFANPAPAVVPLSNEQDDIEIVQEEGRMFQPRAITSSFAQSDIDDDHAEFDNLGGINSFGWDEPSTTEALDLCKKYVLSPYHVFLKVIGWRSFRSKFDTTPLYKKICNVIYPVFIFTMLVFTSASQITSCFSRSKSTPPRPTVPPGNFTILECDDHIVTADILSYFLILGSFIGGFYIFRFSDTEHLSSLSETVFLSYNYTTKTKSRKFPVFILLGFLAFGLLWVMFSFITNIMRMFALELQDPNTIIHWFTNSVNATDQLSHLKFNKETYNGLQYFFVCSSLLGFMFFDLLYIAVVINYTSQCQMLLFYIENIIEKVKAKHYHTLNDATKEVYHIYEFLKVLNGKLAFVTTMIIFVFMVNIFRSYIDLGNTHEPFNIVLGFLNLIQWIAAALFPILMAAFLTRKGSELRRLGLEVASRPYVYSDTSDLELEMFLNYVDSTRYVARLSYVPMYPSLVYGGFFIIFLFLTLGAVIPPPRSIPWF